MPAGNNYPLFSQSQIKNLKSHWPHDLLPLPKIYHLFFRLQIIFDIKRELIWIIERASEASTFFSCVNIRYEVQVSACVASSFQVTSFTYQDLKELKWNQAENQGRGSCLLNRWRQTDKKKKKRQANALLKPCNLKFKKCVDFSSNFKVCWNGHKV